MFYVPDLKTNLLGVGKLQKKSYIIHIHNGLYEIHDPIKGGTVVIQMSENMLYPLKIEMVRARLIAMEDDPSWLWHHRYGYLNFSGMKMLQKKNMVIGIPHIDCPSHIFMEDDPSWLWHHHCGYLNFNGLKTLRKKNMIIGIP